MKLCAAQYKSLRGEMSKNVERHLRFAEAAAATDATLIVFPELSLTGYEPTLAATLATNIDDPRLQPLQTLSQQKKLILCAGLPIQSSDHKPHIGMVILQPDLPPHLYTKGRLHDDELPFFQPGTHHPSLHTTHEHITFAICYESLLEEHAKEAAKAGASIYVASVAKAAKGLKRAYEHMPSIAQRHSMTVLMANALGPSDDFVSLGQSAAWDKKGQLIGSLDQEEEGLLVIDTGATPQVEKVPVR